MSRFLSGKWLTEDKDGYRTRLFVAGFLTDGRMVVEVNPDGHLRVVEVPEMAFMTLLPDCSGWDWVEPAPVSKVIDVNPGDGWRWLEPHEPLLEGDQWFCVHQGQWHESGNWRTNCEQAEGLCYRRKIKHARFWCRGSANETLGFRSILIATENPGGCCEVVSDGDGGWILREELEVY